MEVLPIVLTIEPRICYFFFGMHSNLVIKLVILVSILNHKPCHIDMCPGKKCDHIKVHLP